MSASSAVFDCTSGTAVGAVSFTAGVLNTLRYLSPSYIADKGPFIGYLDGILSIVLLLLVATVLVDSVRRWTVILAARRLGAIEVPMAHVGDLGAPAEPPLA